MLVLHISFPILWFALSIPKESLMKSFCLYFLVLLLVFPVFSLGFPHDSESKILLQCGGPGLETRVDPRFGKILWKRPWQPTPVFLPGESPWTEETGGLPTVHGVTKSQTRLTN